jgi:glutamate-1-semialdehyde 2,1-aminomutase
MTSWSLNCWKKQKTQMADSIVDYSIMINSLIPGGAHTYSRGDDQFPANAPPILNRGEGAWVWDMNGNKYLDYGMALRAVTLGYSYQPVANAAIEEIRKGNNLTRASITELKAAETLTGLIPSANMVKFAKNGSTVTTAAVKLARAYTGKKYIVRCLDHPFFSYDDWFIGDTVLTRGIPGEISSLTLHFDYNHLDSLRKLFDRYPQQIACVIMEPVTVTEPYDHFLADVKELCHANGALFILDEVITGFRYHLQGAQTLYGIEPDMTTFGKGMANGFSVAALTGKREVMELGGIKKEGAERVFLISTTHGAEMCGLGAFIQTVEEYKKHDVIGHLWKYGTGLMKGMNALAEELGIADCFCLEGFPCSPYFVAGDREGNASPGMRTLFLQEMVKNRVLMPWIALSFSHHESELDMTLEAARKSLGIYAKALEDGWEKYLEGQPVKPVFRKYN